MSGRSSFPVLGRVRAVLKLSRRTRLTLELFGIAALAVAMGLGFGKMRQPGEPHARIEAVEAAPKPAAAAPPATAAPALAQQAAEVTEPRAVAAETSITPGPSSPHRARPRRAQPVKPEPPPAPPPNPAPAPAAAARVNAWDTNGYGGRR